MTQHINSKKSTLIVLLVLFEVLITPKFHILLSLKFMYIILGLWTLNYLIYPKYIGMKVKIAKNSRTNKLIYRIMALVFLGIMGEMTIRLFTRTSSLSNFTEAFFIYFIMASCLGIGYIYFDFNKRLMIWLLYLNIFANISTSIMGSNMPYFLTLIWSSYREIGVRNHGIVGNANASLAIMNSILLFVVVLHKKNKIKIGSISSVLIIILPIICNLFINSRGELINSVLILSVFAFNSIKSNDSSLKKLIVSVGLISTCILLYNTGIDYLISKYPRLQYSIERMSLTRNIFDVNTQNTSESILRPLYAYDDFIHRFVKSPIWGTGFGNGYDFPFIRGGMSFHNDIFSILVNTGVAGMIVWISILKISYRLGGIVMLFPFITTAISNTFIFSNAAMATYFLLLGVLIKYNELEN